MRLIANCRTAAVALMLVASPAYAMDAAAGIAGLSIFASIAVGVAAGAMAGWRRWRFWAGIVVAWGACAVLVVLAYFLLRGRFDLGHYIELFFIGAFVSAIPLAVCFAVAYALGSLFARSALAPGDNGSDCGGVAKPTNSV